MNQHPDVPVSITSARASRSSDIRKRQIRYLCSMGLRTACFVLAVVTTGPLRWVFVAGAIILPYIAVVLANATDQRQSGAGPELFRAEDPPHLGRPLDKPADKRDDDV